MQEDFKIYVRPRRDRPGRWNVEVRSRTRGYGSRQFSTEKEARAFRDEISKNAAGLGFVGFDRTFEAAVAGFIESLKAKQSEPKTVTFYREMLEPALDAIGSGAAVATVTQEAVDRYLEARAKQVGRACLRHNAYTLKRALEWAQRKGWATDIPHIELLALPPPRQEWLRSDEIEPFLQACSTPLRPLAEAAIYFGVRVGEICVTQAGDFDLSAEVLWVREKAELDWRPKNKRARGIPLVGRGMDIAKRISKYPAHDWAWPNLKGDRRKPGSWFSKATRRATEQAGITRSLVFHDLRRTFGATMIEAGAHIRAVQQALGHSSVRTTEAVYAPITQSFVADGMRKMDALLEAKSVAYNAARPQPPKRLRVVR